MSVPAKATNRQTREHNQQLVLRTLYDHGPISRAEVARRTGLTRTSVGELVAQLQADGLLHEVGRGPSTGGKAPILVRVDADSRHVIGLDLGERAFSGAVVNLRGEIRRTAVQPVEGRDGDAALAAVYRLVDELVEGDRTDLLGIGVGTPGLVDAAAGTIRWAVNLDWQDLPLAALLRRRYDLPTYVANDSRAAALAEYLFAGGPRGANLIAIKVGQGIGAGLVLDGRLFHGDGSGAGEIGHTTVDDAGAACRCGRHGCLETVASSRAILADAAAATGREELTLDDVREAVAAGDATMLEIVRRAGAALGRAIAALIGTLDVERIVLHGAVPTLGTAWLEAVETAARHGALPALGDRVRLEIGRTEQDVVVLGASALLMTRELGLVPAR